MRTVLRLWLSLLVLSLAGTSHALTFETPYVTRAEAVMILLQTRLSVVPNIAADTKFPDVEHGQWYERYIVLGEKFKIIEADSQTLRIRPADPVTRAEFIKMAARTFALPENLPYLYKDVPPGSWYAAYAGIARAYTLFPGDLDQSVLQPGQVLTHDEVVRALQNVIRRKQVDAPDFRTALFTPTILPAPAPLATASSAPALRTSTEQEQITVIKPEGPAPKPGPVLFVGAAIDPAFDATTLPYLRDAVIKLVNIERVQRGLKPVLQNDALTASAQRYAEMMARQGFFSHVSPDGETFRDRVEGSGYYKDFYQQDCLCLGRYMMAENIARGQKTPQEVMKDWMNSPEHKAAILTPEFTDIGVGIRAGLWVEHFGALQRSDSLSAPRQ
jgi:uncharacterized protein YkwD